MLEADCLECISKLSGNPINTHGLAAEDTPETPAPTEEGPCTPGDEKFEVVEGVRYTTD